MAALLYSFAKKYIPGIAALLFISSGGLYGQNRNLKQVMELQMPKTADDALCRNPVTKKHYAVFCGNIYFGMGVFNAAGKSVSGDDLTTREGYLKQPLKLPDTAPVESMFNFAFSNGIY